MKKLNKFLIGLGANLTIASMALATTEKEFGGIGTGVVIGGSGDNGLGTDIVGKINNALGIAQLIGFVVAIVMIIWVGIKYLTSGAGKKAEAKDTLIPIVIGAGLVALAPTIAKALFNAFA